MIQDARIGNRVPEQLGFDLAPAVLAGMPGGMRLEMRTDAGLLVYDVDWGSHHQAAYTAASVALLLMDAQGYHVVEVETPNDVVIGQMRDGHAVHPDHLFDAHMTLQHVCKLFNKVTWKKV